jgi:hypothetical protein
VQVEPEQNERTDSDEDPDRRHATLGDDHRAGDREVGAGGEPAVRARLEDAEYHEEQSDRGQDRAEQVEARRCSRACWVRDPHGHDDDCRHNEHLQDE